ncbi:MAG: glycosyltransferase [Planctomycetaceae bacterium]|nr:glycosyltransferase [Planctomycetaceae bacterium]
MSAEQPQSLVVFSDDWGRHPSSCQHLIRQLLPDYRVLWVNTIGTRAPRLDWNTVKRVAEKLRQWGRTPDAEPTETHGSLEVTNPRMWPWFTRAADRRLNAWLLERQLAPQIRQLPGPVTALTTLPITADLTDRLPVDRWVYYCVDDFSEWPGLDAQTLRTMDDDMIARADQIVAVSEHLQTIIARHARDSSLLTHGVDLEHWMTVMPDQSRDGAGGFPDLPGGPLAVFWGVIDRRLDTAMLTALSRELHEGHIVLAGPQQDPDPAIMSLPNVMTTGPVPFDRLPALAARADVLVMPYADLPVTRAMQPLKMKEYLATGRPVVVSELPAVAAWQDCMDVCRTAEEFASAVRAAVTAGLPAAQQSARKRLQQESWAAKAKMLQQTLCRQDVPLKQQLVCTP